MSEPSKRAMIIASGQVQHSHWCSALLRGPCTCLAGDARRELAEAIDMFVAEERRRCINDVCPYCAGRACGWEPAEGPNEAGNYTHSKPGHKPALCVASSIFARNRFEGVDRG
jgi:hypothetical protein